MTPPSPHRPALRRETPMFRTIAFAAGVSPLWAETVRRAVEEASSAKAGGREGSAKSVAPNG